MKATSSSSSSLLQQVMEEAKKIQKDFGLCDSCLGRLFAKKLSLSSNRLLGKKIHKKIGKKPAKKCYICKDLIDNLDPFHLSILEKTRDYQFDSFLVGTILKHSVTERDDLIRSKFRLMGIDSVKTDISRQLAKRLSQKTRSPVDHLRPDLTVTVNFKDNSVDLRSRSLILAGRYAKSSRNLPQKQKHCQNCKGKGCMACNFHGIAEFDSVEGKISQFLYEKFSSPQVRITWIGGEDKTSLVGGSGRPFFAQIINPKKRRVRLAKTTDLGGIKILGPRQIPSMPKLPLRFRSEIELSLETCDELPPGELKKLDELNGSQVAIYEESKRVEKSIYSARHSRTGPKSFRLFLEVDGGVPIKKFVDGQTVFPNLSDLLGTKCLCKEFDFHRVAIQ